MRLPYDHEVFMDFFIGRLPAHRHNALERRRQAEGLVVWLVGLSSGVIALILSGKGTLGWMEPLALKLAVGCALLTIVFGVVFRVFSYGVGELEGELMDGFEGFCAGYRSSRHGPIEIDESSSIEHIARRLKEDMGLDYDEWLGDEHLDREFWLNMYRGFAALWREQEREGKEVLTKAIAPVVGVELGEIEPAGRDERDTMRASRKAIRFRRVCSWSFVLMTVFFVLSVAAVAVGFLAQ